MKKKLAVCALSGLLGLSTIAGYECAVASDFSSEYDWKTSEKDSVTYDNIALKVQGDGDAVTYYTWDQTINFDPAAARIESATLALRYSGILGPNSELWALVDGNRQTVANLEANHDQFNWYTQEINIYSLLQSFTGSTITLGLTLQESTNGCDDILLDKSSITGTYSPVPVPSSALLLGSSILGLVGFASRRRS